MQFIKTENDQIINYTDKKSGKQVQINYQHNTSGISVQGCCVVKVVKKPQKTTHIRDKKIIK